MTLQTGIHSTVTLDFLKQITLLKSINSELLLSAIPGPLENWFYHIITFVIKPITDLITA